ncbi:translation initiation factor 2 [Micromonospora cathayae]|uniref:Translation initiation factor 2 n=1 Tax=Micromonospora cathayae TaxID=3028804 RepID=A0ABY7ZWB9_9ACTN|nr:translation initiation factor 2 [Micromonospora sp. HUAS 3]WDZ86681.1 translation initiation factor 2 [Micromonospora sp. HUAS 3]
MTTPHGSDDDYWRRPPPGESPPPVAPRPPAAPASGYTGPPPSTAPPPDWRPPVHVQPAPPRRLPAQDADALDAAEQRAQRVTYGIGILAGAVLLVVVCLICTRTLF